MISNVRQISMPELRSWARERNVEIREHASRDLCGNRIFSADNGDEVRVAKVPPDESPEIRAMWNARAQRELQQMSWPALTRYLMECPVFGYAGPQA
ncbi:hypothetical protein ACFOVU_11195 [Nocardiopsis sediminis]|uniref:Uncharacterized protein n=1 Tax=Nocardiopsis sediminis TaxID=1778267 RepID=A0ABV8FK16_9ACTN